MSKRPPSFDDQNATKKKSSDSNVKENVTYAELLQAAGNCWSGLLTCQRCKQIPDIYSRSGDKKWLMELYCKVCQKPFQVCTICANNRRQFLDKNDVRNHTKLNSHRKRMQKIEDAEADIVDNSEISLVEAEPVSAVPTEKYLQANNLQYFKMEAESKGNACLFASSFFPQHVINYSIINDNDTKFNLSLANFIYSLPKSSRKKFVSLISMMKEHMLPQQPNQLQQHPFALRIPSSFDSLRVDQVDTHIRKLHGGKPIWAQRYNLLCLLNCKEDMKRYGPARCRWEGNDSGEKNIQPIKNSFNGFRTNWELHTHKNYFVGKTMNKLQLNEEKNARLESKERSILHLYSCPEDALSAYLLKKPLFIVRLTNSDFGVLHTSNRFRKLSGFEFKNEIVHVCHFDLKLLSDTQKDVSMSESMIANVCLAIPFESLYVILDMEWKELDSDLNFNYGYK